MRLEKPT